jgi:hypothetical protein
MEVQNALKTKKVVDVLTQLDVTGATLEKILKFNGKSTKSIDDYKKVRATTDEEPV